MKTPCATFLSLLLVLAQAFFFLPATVSAQTASEGAKVSARSCCDGPTAHACSCCVNRTTSPPAQFPAVPAPTSSGALAAGPLNAVVTPLWVLPAPPACLAASAPDASFSAPAAVPLFLRHGVLLI